MQSIAKKVRTDIIHVTAMLALAAFACLIHAASAHAIFIPDSAQHVKDALKEAMTEIDQSTNAKALESQQSMARPSEEMLTTQPDAVKPVSRTQTTPATTAAPTSDQAIRVLLGEAIMQAALGQR